MHWRIGDRRSDAGRPEPAAAPAASNSAGGMSPQALWRRRVFQKSTQAAVELESVKRALRPLASDELGLAETVDGLGQGVVIGIAAGADRGDGTRVGESLGVPDRQVLDPPIAVVDEPAEVGRPATPDRHLEGVEGELGAQAGRNPPADDPAAEGIDEWLVDNSLALWSKTE